MTTLAFIVLVFLQLGDWISSILASKIPGAHEANPIVAWLMARVGFNGALAIEKVLALALGFILTRSFIPSPMGAIMLAALDALYAYIVWKNLRIAKIF